MKWSCQEILGRIVLAGVKDDKRWNRFYKWKDHGFNSNNLTPGDWDKGNIFGEEIALEANGKGSWAMQSAGSQAQSLGFILWGETQQQRITQFFVAEKLWLNVLYVVLVEKTIK